MKAARFKAVSARRQAPTVMQSLAWPVWTNAPVPFIAKGRAAKTNMGKYNP
ncbi:hypothetical protein EBBID32_19520 [Sphingobium indicum BiD32]|uniref:Uncharacterized protein n=1 Tax=Sphingobium indicum BiD32 TaxID=1301087 RepID=N1MKZ6_9SPHN|nr:hypothetical protein EBBID32_19520 [Sphingobium indicum BiD32]